MRTPRWIRPAAYGVVVGAIGVAAVGFTWGGWVTGNDARTGVLSAVEASRTELAAEICVGKFLAAEDASERLAELQSLPTSTEQREFVESGGWAFLMPGDYTVARPISDLCATMLSDMGLPGLS